MPQLGVRYAMAVDEWDVEGWLELLIADLRVGRAPIGRQALRDFIAPHLRRFYRSIQ